MGAPGPVPSSHLLRPSEDPATRRKRRGLGKQYRPGKRRGFGVRRGSGVSVPGGHCRCPGYLRRLLHPGLPGGDGPGRHPGSPLYAAPARSLRDLSRGTKAGRLHPGGHDPVRGGGPGTGRPARSLRPLPAHRRPGPGVRRPFRDPPRLSHGPGTGAL